MTSQQVRNWGARAGHWTILGGLTIFLAFPFGGVSIFVDIVAILACGIVLFLAFDALRDLR